MAQVVQEKRKYQRILPSDKSIDILESKGFEWVFSSNVSAVATSGINLVIRFHNGSIYSYAGKAKDYERIMGAASKGKWVWRFLRRPQVPYQKIGSLPLAEDTTETDEEIVKPRIPTYDVKAIVPKDFATTGKLPQISISPISTILPIPLEPSNILTGVLMLDDMLLSSLLLG